MKENYTKKIPQGILAPLSILYNNSNADAKLLIGLLGRDRNAWFQSTQYIERLEVVLGAKIVFGHDLEVFKTLRQSPECYH